MLFEGDLARLGHPIHVETLGKQGECVLKIRCHIYRTLISYYNGLWTCVVTHIRSHNIATTQDIAAADALASESEANGEPFPIHKLPTPPAVKKEATGDAALMLHTFVAPSYKPNTQPYNRIKRTIANWRQAGHCIRDDRLQVEGSILLLTTTTLAIQVGHCIRDKRLQV